MRSCGIVVIGSPIGIGYRASLSEETDDTVTKGADPGNEGGGDFAPLRELGGDEGALFIRSLSRNVVLLFNVGCSRGVGGRGPVGGGARGPTDIGFPDPTLPLLKLLLCPPFTLTSSERGDRFFVGGVDNENLKDFCVRDSRKDFMGEDLPVSG